jgi:hypothetical protein
MKRKGETANWRPHSSNKNITALLSRHRRLVVNNDRKSRRTAVAIFAVALTVAVIAAFITTFEGVSTRQASNEAQPGTTGLAHPHPPLDIAPGEPVRN